MVYESGIITELTRKKVEYSFILFFIDKSNSIQFAVLYIDEEKGILRPAIYDLFENVQF